MKQMDPLMRVIKDHEKVSEFLEDMRQVMNFLHDKEAWSKVKPIEDFFQQNIRLILELQREHGIILAKLEEFQRIVLNSVIPLDEEKSAELNLVARKIIDILLIHASKEDDNILPVLEKNKQIFD
jgi:hemerythrin-like domain-containing protein